MVAGRTSRARLTVEYSREERPFAPVIPLVLHDLLHERSREVSAKLDTGFAGSVLVPFAVYLELGLPRFEAPEGEVQGRLVTGLVVPLRMATAVARVADFEAECEVYTTRYPVRALVGRALLNRWVTTLDGPPAKLTVAMP